MWPARALVFDFNGTLSHDEPLLYGSMPSCSPERGRPLAESDYYARLAGNTEEAIMQGWLGVEGDELASLINERIDRYVRLADGIDRPRADPSSGAARREPRPGRGRLRRVPARDRARRRAGGPRRCRPA